MYRRDRRLVSFLVLFAMIVTLAACSKSPDNTYSENLPKKTLAGTVQYYENLLKYIRAEELKGGESEFEVWRINSKNATIRELRDYFETVDLSLAEGDDGYDSAVNKCKELYSKCISFEVLISRDEHFLNYLDNLIYGLEERVYYYNTGNKDYMKVYPVKVAEVSPIIVELKELSSDFREGAFDLEEATNKAKAIFEKLKKVDETTHKAESNSFDLLVNGYDETRIAYYVKKMQPLIISIGNKKSALESVLTAHKQGIAKIDEDDFIYKQELNQYYLGIKMQLSELLEAVKDGKVNADEFLAEYNDCVDGIKLKYNYAYPDYKKAVHAEFVKDFYYDIEFVRACA